MQLTLRKLGILLPRQNFEVGEINSNFIHYLFRVAKVVGCVDAGGNTDKLLPKHHLILIFVTSSNI